MKTLISVTDAVGCATVGLTVGVFGAILGVAGSAALMAFSGDKASLLESELQRKAKLGQELEMHMAKARLALEGKQSQEEKLVILKLASTIGTDY